MFERYPSNSNDISNRILKENENVNMSLNNKTEKLKEKHKFHMHDFLGTSKDKFA